MFGALLTNLSKAFDCLDHKLLIAKRNAYSFSLPALKLVHDYLSNRKQRTKVNRAYSSWLEIVFGVPQGFIVGPLMFNIFLADLFFMLNDVRVRVCVRTYIRTCAYQGVRNVCFSEILACFAFLKHTF